MRYLRQRDEIQVPNSWAIGRLLTLHAVCLSIPGRFTSKKMVHAISLLSILHFGKDTGVEHTVLPDDQLPTVAFTVIAQQCGLKADESEMETFPFHRRKKVTFERNFDFGNKPHFQIKASKFFLSSMDDGLVILSKYSATCDFKSNYVRGLRERSDFSTILSNILLRRIICIGSVVKSRH